MPHLQLPGNESPGFQPTACTSSWQEGYRSIITLSLFQWYSSFASEAILPESPVCVHKPIALKYCPIGRSEYRRIRTRLTMVGLAALPNGATKNCHLAELTLLLPKLLNIDFTNNSPLIPTQSLQSSSFQIPTFLACLLATTSSPQSRTALRNFIPYT